MEVSQDRLEVARCGEDLKTLLAELCIIGGEKEVLAFKGLSSAPALPLISWVSFAKLLHVSESQFPHVDNSHDNPRLHGCKM